MKKPFFFFFAVCAIIACVACAKKAQSTEAKDIEPVNVVDTKAELAKATAAHKADAYQRFMAKGGTLDPYFTENAERPVLDLDSFLKDLGLKYTVLGDSIVIEPDTQYALDEDFMYTIFYEGDMIHGNRTEVGRNADGWQTTDKYDSATDFIFLAKLNGKTYYIGCDELDVMYKSLRVLTTPADKVTEVEKAIDAELTYSEEPIEEIQG